MPIVTVKISTKALFSFSHLHHSPVAFYTLKHIIRFLRRKFFGNQKLSEFEESNDAIGLFHS
jgi:hypothetical protein